MGLRHKWSHVPRGDWSVMASTCFRWFWENSRQPQTAVEVGESKGIGAGRVGLWERQGKVMPSQVSWRVRGSFRNYSWAFVPLKSPERTYEEMKGPHQPHQHFAGCHARAGLGRGPGALPAPALAGALPCHSLHLFTVEQAKISQACRLHSKTR